jgi:tetrapyrrole methylase family protein/MazG family protein
VSALPSAHLAIVGLGPGSVDQLTPEARALLTGGLPVIARTKRHPTVERLPSAGWRSFDELYDMADDFDALYAAMLGRLRAALAEVGGPVVYAVPGHPLFAEATVRAVLAADLPARVVPGLSLLDAAATALRRDPIAEGWQLLDALDLARVVEADPFAGGMLPYSPLRPALICQVYSRRVASAVKLALMRVLPNDHPVTLVQAAGVAGQERILTLPLHRLDRAETAVDHLTSLYAPAQAPLSALRVPQTLAHITARLRAPGGCPWDREQTHRSLAPHAIEEAYEVVEAIEREDPAALAEELGDLLLQVVLHAQLAEEAADFTLEDVVEAISAKLIRRHPHVFGDLSVSGSAEVLRNWDQIKAAERQAKRAGEQGSGGAGEQEGGEAEESAVEAIFAGIPRSLPALSRAQTVQRRVVRAGQPAPDPAALPATLTAAVDAALAAGDTETRRARLGEALFAAVELARHLGLDAEEALRLATDAYRSRVEAAGG